MLGAIVSTLVFAFVIGLLARWTVPGPDPMPIWMTTGFGLVGAPWRTRKKPVARRSHVLARLVDYGAELIVAGHVHQGAVCERRELAP